MLNFDKQLYIVDCKYFKTPHLCSHGEVQELIKRNYSDIASIHKANIIAGEQVDFKHFIPKCYRTEYNPSIYYCKNLWCKIWNDIELD